jgi:hypothetical protein
LSNPTTHKTETGIANKLETPIIWTSEHIVIEKRGWKTI